MANKSFIPRVPCAECSGSGKTALPKHLIEVWKDLKGHKEATVEQIAARVDNGGWSHGSISNRLVELEQLGLVTRTRKSRTFFWSITTTKEKGAK